MAVSAASATSRSWGPCSLPPARAAAVSRAARDSGVVTHGPGAEPSTTRRSLLAAPLLLLPLAAPGAAPAVQGYTAGRIPGLGDVDDEGYRRYTRPAGKSGGHGIGWSGESRPAAPGALDWGDHTRGQGTPGSFPGP